MDARAQALSALAQAEHEQEMRAELARAMTGLVAGADLAKVHAALNADETAELVSLAMFAARTRTAVERDGYTGDLLVMPQPEGPARLIKAMRRMYGGLGAIGVDPATRWSVVSRIALDCAPAIRVPLMRALLATDGPTRTADLGRAAGLVTKTASRQLDDLAMLGIAEHSKKSEADNSPDMWTATPWLREHWPKEVGQRNTPQPPSPKEHATTGDRDARPVSTAPRTSLSYFPEPAEPSPDHHCQVCDRLLAPLLVEQGHAAHPSCEELAS